MSLRGAVFLLLTLPAVALAAPEVGPELLIGQPSYAGARGEQQAPSAVWTGTHHMVFWLNTRGGQALMAARVTADGRNLDPLGIVLHRSVSPSQPYVSWDGQNVLVTWAESTNVPRPMTSIHALRVAPDGTIRDPGPQLIATGVHLRKTVWDGTHHQVAVVSADSATELSLVSISPDGAVGEPLVISRTAFPKASVAMATGAGKLLIAWSQRSPSRPTSETDAIMGAWVSGKRVEASDVPLVSSTDSPAPISASWNGTSFLLTYSLHT